jgi:predicted nucleotidyltransferase component of viral defense system
LEPYKLERLEIMHRILSKVNRGVNSDNFVLKGGTGLLLCHGLDRFSEDIDLDASRKVNIEKEILMACNEMDKYASISVAKDTGTVLRYKVDYESIRSEKYPLKVEISLRNKPMLLSKLNVIEIIKGIRVYSLKDLLNMKQVAFLQRDKVRDFYDIYWCLKNRPDLFDDNVARQVLESLHYKGVDTIVEVLKEEASDDHILTKLDADSVMIEFMTLLEKCITPTTDKMDL